MKKFYDLRLQVPLNDFCSAERMFRKASMLGYSGVGVPFPNNVSNNAIYKLRQLCSDAGIDLVTRMNLVPKSANELLSQLRRFRRKFELVSVSCLSKPVARQAAKDRRVDLVSFPSIDFRKRFFDSAEAELAANALAALEIDVSRLISATGFERIHLLSNIRREVAVAKRFSVPVVVSSGAVDEFSMRKPQDLAAFTYLFDMPSINALDGLSEKPLTIVKRNRAKLSPNYVAPGIRIVRRGKDCGER